MVERLMFPGLRRTIRWKEESAPQSPVKRQAERSYSKDIILPLAQSLDTLTPAAPSMTWRVTQNDDTQSAKAAQQGDVIAELLHGFLGLLETNFATLPTSEKDHAKRQLLLSNILEAALLPRLVASLEWLHFEAQKCAMRAFESILRLSREISADAKAELAEHVLRQHPETCKMLLVGSGKPEVFSYCTLMLRACAKHSDLTEGLLSHYGGACHLIDLAGHQCFDIASEAFATLRELLLSHPDATLDTLGKAFIEFFESYHALLQDGKDYVTLRQALRLLSEMLMNRKFMEVMVRYVGNEKYLQIHMNLLRDKSPSIRLDAFHMFKIFVANPRKPAPVQKILRRNSERLIKLLDSSFADKQDDKENSALHRDLQTVRGVLAKLHTEGN